MIHSFTPSGVEHFSPGAAISTSSPVIHSFTPSGVEHSSGDPISARHKRDSFVYAVRR